jgi:PAS domain-containing protein
LTAGHGGPLQHPPGTDALWQQRLQLLLDRPAKASSASICRAAAFINRAGAGLIGYEPAELLGRNMHELTHHSHADGRAYPDSDCPIFKAFRQGLPCRIDTEVFWRRDGRPFRSSTPASPSWTARACAARSSPLSTSPAAPRRRGLQRAMRAAAQQRRAGTACSSAPRR